MLDRVGNNVLKLKSPSLRQKQNSSKAAWKLDGGGALNTRAAVFAVMREAVLLERAQVLATRIEDALQRNLPLDGLTGDKHQLPPHMRCLSYLDC